MCVLHVQRTYFLPLDHSNSIFVTSSFSLPLWMLELPIKLFDSVIQKAPVWIWRIPHGKCGRTVFTLELLTY